MQQCNTVSFKGQIIFIGMDVHKNSWRITERHCGRNIKTYSMLPDPLALFERLRREYPDAEYRSVYEAGFCGFWIDRQLNQLGVKNIVVNPADIPTSDKEKAFKNDVRDSRKLARELECGHLTPIYVPSLENLRLRDLVRRENQLVSNMVRVKNRLKAYGKLYGNNIEKINSMVLRNMNETALKNDDATQLSLLHEFSWLRQHKVELIRAERRYLEQLHRTELQKNLMSIPGIGFRTALVIQAEIWEIQRFSSPEALCGYVGVAPRIFGSGECAGDGERTA